MNHAIPKRNAVNNSIKGFTLVELLIVVSIMAVLTAIILASFQTARAKTRDTVRFSELVQLRTALNRYYTDNGSYPVTPNQWYSSEPTDANFSNNSGNWIPGLVASGMVPVLPRDPLGGLSTNAVCAAATPPFTREFVYKSDGVNYKLISICAIEVGSVAASNPFYDPIRATQSAAQVSSSPTIAATW
jgi:general secretion pathway protein G